MSTSKLLLAAGLLASALAEVKVTVYEGPTECDAADKTKKGSFLGMHYTGKIDETSATGEKGKEFDSSRGRGQTFDFKLGGGQVIKGWDEGLVGLCKGAKATLVIPPAMGYGEKGAGKDIPGGATLNFDVEVVSISDKGPEEPNIFNDLDENKDGKLASEEILAFFKKQGQETLPDGLWESEDKDKDGFVSWEEFSGPKGDEPPTGADEL